MRGYSLIELVFVTWLAVVITAIAIPRLLTSLDDRETAVAVRYVATRCMAARMEALRQSRDVAVRFTTSGTDYAYGMYADGNGDGVTTRDIQRGVDATLAAPALLSWQFPGVGFAVPSGLPPVDPGPLTDGDPVKLGSGNLLSYSAAGTSSSGSLYIRGRSGAQYVIRALGETGRVRTLKFNPRARRWDPA